jgi:hypothetical protein
MRFEKAAVVVKTVIALPRRGWEISTIKVACAKSRV